MTTPLGEDGAAERIAGLPSGGDPRRLRTRLIDRVAYANDASHYLLTPLAVVTARDSSHVGELMRACDAAGLPVTFRSGGTSLSGQAVTSGLLVDTRNEPLRRGGLQYLVRQCYRFAGVHDRVSRGALVHTLRHEFATRLAENGASAHELKELLGHSSIVTGQHYVEATARELRSAAGSSPAYGALEKILRGGAAPP